MHGYNKLFKQRSLYGEAKMNKFEDVWRRLDWYWGIPAWWERGSLYGEGKVGTRAGGPQVNQCLLAGGDKTFCYSASLQKLPTIIQNALPTPPPRQNDRHV